MELGKHPMDYLLDDPDDHEPDEVTVTSLTDAMQRSVEDWNLESGDRIPSDRAYLERLARTVLDELGVDVED